MHTALIAVNTLALLFQAAAAVRAVLLIRETGKKSAWYLTSAALFLMALRRFLTLWAMVRSGSGGAFWFDLAGFFISFAMLLGIWNIRPIFRSLQESERKISALLAEKDAILREAHHRIKNNMNTMRILIGAQADMFPDPAVRAAFADSQGRIDAMMVLYDKLYHSPTMTAVSARTYLSDLAGEIVQLFPDRNRVRLEVTADDTVLSAADSFPLGIILNELLTNAMKYAVPGQENPAIQVTLRTQDGMVRMSVRDNGPGLPEDFDLQENEGFGLTLIRMLAEQLDGTVEAESGNGCVWTVAVKSRSSG